MDEIREYELSPLNEKNFPRRNLFTDFPYQIDTLLEYLPPIVHHTHPKKREKKIKKKELEPICGCETLLKRVEMGIVKRNNQFLNIARELKVYPQIPPKNLREFKKRALELREDKELRTTKVLAYVFPSLVWTIKPPRKILDKNYIQNISTTPRREDEHLRLFEKLLNRLFQRKARMCGLCPIRRELYDQLFDELTRQAILCDAGGGFLLNCFKKYARTEILRNEKYIQLCLDYGQKKIIQFEESGEQDSERTKLLKEILSLKRNVKEMEEAVNTQIESIDFQESRAEFLHNCEIARWLAMRIVLKEKLIDTIGFDSKRREWQETINSEDDKLSDVYKRMVKFGAGPSTSYI